MAVAAEIVIIIIPPSSKTEGPISEKNIIPSSSKITENDHPAIIQDSRGPQQEKNKKALVVIIFVRSHVPAKWDDGEMSPIVHPKSG